MKKKISILVIHLMLLFTFASCSQAKDILYVSYIAPGSSAGILINENFEVIGITTIGLYADNKTLYLAGGSIPTFVFKKFLSNLNENNLIRLNQ